MIKIVKSLVGQLASGALSKHSLIEWAAPAPCFGNYKKSNIATVGINPSNLEFQDRAGLELRGNSRRLHSLQSLGISAWSEATTSDIRKIVLSCENYFHRNPYTTWFNHLNYLFADTGCSFYDHINHACHLDLVPFSTSKKWTMLNTKIKKSLILNSRQTFYSMIEYCGAQLIILNGQQVVDEYQKIVQEPLESFRENQWDLSRRRGPNVKGIAYEGYLHKKNGGKIRIIGYNHNIQSSYGITKAIRCHIRNWIADNWSNILK